MIFLFALRTTTLYFSWQSSDFLYFYCSYLIDLLKRNFVVDLRKKMRLVCFYKWVRTLALTFAGVHHPSFYSSHWFWGGKYTWTILFPRSFSFSWCFQVYSLRFSARSASSRTWGTLWKVILTSICWLSFCLDFVSSFHQFFSRQFILRSFSRLTGLCLVANWSWLEFLLCLSWI